MLTFRSRWLLPAAALAASVAAHAGHEFAPEAPGDPLDAEATVPPVVYESPFARYRAQTEGGPKSWKEANDNVGRTGGWRSYAREAAQGDAPGASQAPVLPAPQGSGAPSRPAGPATKPAPKGHSGHQTY